MCTLPVPRLSVTRESQGAVEPRYGLFAAATIVEDMPAHAHAGVQYVVTCEPGVNVYPVFGCPGDDVPPDNPAKTGARTIATATADPFAVYAAETCFPGGRDQNEASARLRTRLLRGERHAVEAAIDSGAAGAAPYLRHPDTEVLADGEPVELADAVGALEHRLAEYGRSGIIHTPRWTGPRMDDMGIAHRDGPRMRTMLGSAIAFGSGYSGRPPEGVDDDGALWVYATPHVTISRSTVIEPATWAEGAFNPATNAPFLLAERVYVVDWACFTLAVKTTLQRAYTPAPPHGLPPDVTVTPASGEAPLDVTATVNNWGAGPVTVDWGDGSDPETVDEDTPAPHTYPTAGEYTVTATSNADPAASGTAKVTVFQDVPEPTGVGGANIGTTDANITWSWDPGSGADATAFSVRYRQSPDGEWTAPQQVPGTERAHYVSGLAAGTEYEAGVVAHIGNLASDEAFGTFTTFTDVAPPTGVTVTETTSTTATVDWSWEQGTGEPIGSFLLAHRTPPGTGEWVDADQVGPDARSHTFDGLDPDTTYEFRITSYAANSQSSAAATGTTAPASPVAPTGVAAAPGDTDPTTVLSVSWTWDQGGGGAADGFYVQYRTPPGTGEWVDADQVGPDATAYDITGLDPGTDYEVGVSAFNAGGTSEPGTATASTDPAG